MANTRVTTVTTTLKDADGAQLHQASLVTSSVSYNDGGYSHMTLAASATGVALPFPGVASAAYLRIETSSNPIDIKLNGSGPEITIRANDVFSLGMGDKKLESVSMDNDNITDAAIKFIVHD